MTYVQTYQFLKKNYDQHRDVIQLPESNLEIHNLSFQSDSWNLLPGATAYTCEEHKLTFEENLGHREESVFQMYPEILKHHDIDICENHEFKYTIFKKASTEKSNGVIFLFHGLSEKYWDKYLPWAEKLVSNTGKAVVLFPIAFHMNRSPVEWSNSRLMDQVAQTRRNHSIAIDNATFANAAICARIQAIPQRFFWSGLHTFYDVVKLLGQIRNGEHPLIHEDCSFDLFSYSIGSFLSEILFMANPQSFFDKARLFMFCGGPTLDRMLPNSKFILDSDATIAIYSFYTERLDRELKHDKRMAHYFNGEHPAGNYFKAMLNYNKYKETREKRLREIAGNIKAVALKKDEVVPPNEVINTLKGENRDIPVEVSVFDYNFPYDHITPFPNKKDIEAEVDKSFNELFEIAARYLQ